MTHRPAPSASPRTPPLEHADDQTAWHALADGRLTAAEAATLRTQLQGNSAALESIDHWQKQRRQLQALHTDLLDAPVPEMLLDSALRTAHRKAQQMQWWRWGGMAASVFMAFALGWAGRGQWSGGTLQLGSGKPPSGGPSVLVAATAQRFAEQAAVAHAVYQPEVRHPVEVGAAQQDHLVQWLSKRLDRPLKVPVLSPLGYELVGGRLLPGDTGARAQFMYQNGAGQRITLYMGALAGAAASPAAAAAGLSAANPAPQATEPSPTTAFQFTSEGPVPGFYWVDAGFGYALSGQLSRAQLLALATAVYSQIQR